MQGHLDYVTARSVVGWAAEDDGAPADVVVKVNGVILDGPYRRLPRPDVTFLPRHDTAGFEFLSRTAIRPGDVVSVTAGKRRLLRNRHLVGSPLKVRELFETRESRALALIEPQMRILEIGPSLRPLAPRSQGWQSWSLDHATADELRAKYQAGHDVSHIEPVDFIWRDGPLDSAVPIDMHGSFDAVIASHVLEHAPDPIGFLLATARLLQPGGLVALVVPDKRFIFDALRPVSTTGEWLQAHHDRRTRHTPKTAFDVAASSVMDGGAIAWQHRSAGDLTFSFREDALTVAMNCFHQAANGGDYVDYHNTVYTPSSFQLIMLELGHLGVLPFTLDSAPSPAFGEFYANLRHGSLEPLPSDALARERMRLAKAALLELAEQVSWMIR